MRELNFPKRWLPKRVAAGIYCEGETVYLAVLRDGPEVGIEQLRQLSLKELKAALEQFPNACLISALGSMDVLLRRIELDVCKDKDIAAVLEFQTEPYLPFSSDEAVLDYAVLKRTKEKSYLSVLAARQPCVEAHLETLQSHAVEPERVTAVPVALAHLIEGLLPDSGAQAVLWLGEETTVCAIVLGGKVLATRSLGSGIQWLREAAPEEGVDLLNLDPADYVQLHERAESLRAEVAKTLLALTSRGGQASTAPQLFIVGAFSPLRNLDVFLATALDMPVSYLPLPPDLQCDPEQLNAFAVPLGLAFSGLKPGQVAPDFRKKKLSYPFPWKKGRRRLITYAVASLLLALSIFLLGLSTASRQAQALRHDCQELAAAVGQESPILDGLSAAEILEQARSIEAQVGATPDRFPLAPDVPYVTDLLNWLCTHPKVVSSEGTLIQVQSLRYNLTKRPDGRKPKERYQVRIDLEFTADSPTAAREFHDALLEESALIDPNQEVKWAATSDGFKASFTLKDKTRYL